jgi:hypothetical protein
MKSRLEIQTCLRSVAFLTTNSRLSRFKLGLIKNILALIIPMVTLLTGEPSFHVTVVGKGDGSPFSLRKGGAIQHHRVWPGPESLSKREKEDGRRERDEKSLLFHSCSIL